MFEIQAQSDREFTIKAKRKLSSISVWDPYTRWFGNISWSCETENNENDPQDIFIKVSLVHPLEYPQPFIKPFVSAMVSESVRTSEPWLYESGEPFTEVQDKLLLAKDSTQLHNALTNLFGREDFNEVDATITIDHDNFPVLLKYTVDSYKYICDIHLVSKEDYCSELNKQIEERKNTLQALDSI